MKHYYDFSISGFKTLEEAAEEAVKRIVFGGLMFRNGQLGPGGNNVLADNAANAFSDAEIHKLKQTGDMQNVLFADIIILRKAFAAEKESDSALSCSALNQIYDKYCKLVEKAGWAPGQTITRLRLWGAPRPR